MTTPYDDIVEEALAFGWVDSQPRSIDQQRSARLLTPRKPGSNWSRLNKQRIERLTAAGLMTTAGRAAVAAPAAMPDPDDRESEGRGRQDDHRGQPGRQPGAARLPGPGDRP